MRLYNIIDEIDAIASKRKRLMRSREACSRAIACYNGWLEISWEVVVIVLQTP